LLGMKRTVLAKLADRIHSVVDVTVDLQQRRATSRRESLARLAFVAGGGVEGLRAVLQ